MLVKLLSHVIHRLYKVKTFFVDEKPVAVAVAFIGVLVLWLLISICRRFYKTVQISELWVYPVKGCRGQRVNSVMVTPKGLLHDRSFAIVNTTTGRVVTQRQEPRMALLSCGLRGFESLEMCMEGVVQVDDNILPLLRDKRLFTVARASPGEYADTNDSLDVDLDLDADSFMDSYISEGEDSVGAAAARVFFNSLNIPIMESALASYLRTLHDNPEYGRLAIEMQEQELRDQVRKKRATEATQGEEPPRPTESQFAALTGPLMLPSGKVDRSGFWRAREPTLPGSPEKSGSSGRKSPGGKGKDNGEFTLPIRKVLVWDEEIECVDCGDFAALWLAVVFPESAGNYRLVRMRDAHVRATPLHPLGGEVEEDSPEEVLRKKKASFGVAAMPDARPILLTNRASLDLLNKKLVRHSNTAKDSKPVSMARFRPNIVVDGAVAFAEDDWSSLVFPTMSALTFFAQPCRRCKVPTNDPDTGLFDEDGEPNTTLKTFHQGAHLGLVDPKAQRENYFGVYLDHGGLRPEKRHMHLTVGDFVEPLVDDVLVQARRVRGKQAEARRAAQTADKKRNKGKSFFKGEDDDDDNNDVSGGDSSADVYGYSKLRLQRNISSVSPRSDADDIIPLGDDELTQVEVDACIDSPVLLKLRKKPSKKKD